MTILSVSLSYIEIEIAYIGDLYCLTASFIRFSQIYEDIYNFKNEIIFFY